MLLAISSYIGPETKSVSNRIDIVTKSLKSLHKTDYPGFVAFVDDGSSTGELLDVFTNLFLMDEKWRDRCSIVEKPKNFGIALVKNTCLRVGMDMKAELIFLADDDVLYKNPFWKIYIDAMRRSKFQHLSYCLRDVGINNQAFYEPRAGVMRQTLLNGMFLAMTKECVEKVGYFAPFPHKYGHEHVNYTIRCVEMGMCDFWADAADSHKYIEAVPGAHEHQARTPTQEELIENQWYCNEIRGYQPCLEERGELFNEPRP